MPPSHCTKISSKSNAHFGFELVNKRGRGDYVRKIIRSTDLFAFKVGRSNKLEWGFLRPLMGNFILTYLSLLSWLNSGGTQEPCQYWVKVYIWTCLSLLNLLNCVEIRKHSRLELALFELALFKQESERITKKDRLLLFSFHVLTKERR